MATDTTKAHNLDEARQFLAEAINRSANDIPNDATVDSLEAWDSLAHMRLLTALESRNGKPLPPNLVVSIRSLEDISEILETGTLSSTRMVSW